MKIKTALTPDIINEAEKVFRDLNWPIIEENYFGICLFDSFCETLNHFDIQKQKFIIDLTRYFLNYPNNLYAKGFLECVSNIPKIEFDDIDEFYLVPLISKDDTVEKSGTKSGGFVLYDLIRYAGHLREKFPNKEFFFCKDLSNSNLPAPIGVPQPDEFNNSTMKIILLDDFIGTGETAISSVNYLIKDLGYSKDNIYIFSFVILDYGLNILQEHGISVFYEISKNKGISDNFPNPKRKIYKKLMEEIEAYLNINEIFKFGYKNSEGLVRVHKTPDNTFPLYWVDVDFKDKRKYRSIFPRN